MNNDDDAAVRALALDLSLFLERIHGDGARCNEEFAGAVTPRLDLRRLMPIA